MSLIVCIYSRSCFPHRLPWISVSYSEPGACVPTFSRFRIPLRRCRPHEPSSRPPCRPTLVAVEAGGRGGARSERKGSPRVEKRAPERGARSFFPSFNDMVLHLYSRQYLYGPFVRIARRSTQPSLCSAVKFVHSNLLRARPRLRQPCHRFGPVQASPALCPCELCRPAGRNQAVTYGARSDTLNVVMFELGASIARPQI